MFYFFFSCRPPFFPQMSRARNRHSFFRSVVQNRFPLYLWSERTRFLHRNFFRVFENSARLGHLFPFLAPGIPTSFPTFPSPLPLPTLSVYALLRNHCRESALFFILLFAIGCSQSSQSFSLPVSPPCFEFLRSSFASSSIIHLREDRRTHQDTFLKLYPPLKINNHSQATPQPFVVYYFFPSCRSRGTGLTPAHFPTDA